MTQWQERISRVGFLTSVSSYAVFWLCDAVRPGFVARYVSVHVFLLSGIVFGIWWTLTVQEYRDRPFVQYAAAALFGVLFAVVTWNVGAPLEAYRLLAVAGAFVTPMVVVALVRNA